MRIGHLVLARFLALSFASVALAQSPAPGTASTTVPTSGSGHDYFYGVSETVNPASGGASFRLKLAVAQGRGPSLPFSIAYDSNGIFAPLQGPSAPGWSHWAVG